ncbi:hypothetical protein SK128_015032 [Halocaridina rubra]|uniref:Uncharacterized protein n=1 Tax=Halocaridina rubra TaxID=373956 RepID=A0AAN8WP81_HALRR
MVKSNLYKPHGSRVLNHLDHREYLRWKAWSSVVEPDLRRLDKTLGAVQFLILELITLCTGFYLVYSVLQALPGLQPVPPVTVTGR